MLSPSPRIGQLAQEEPCGARADLLEVLVHRGQLGGAVPAGLDVVEADDGDVLRDPDAPAAQTVEQVERGAVGRPDQCGAAFAGRLGCELPGCGVATELPARGEPRTGSSASPCAAIAAW